MTKVVKSPGPGAVTLVNAVWRNLVGTLMMLAGLGLLAWEIMSNKAVHGAHVWIFVGIAVFGALIVVPDAVKIIAVLAPYTPWAGGRRAGDPPRPEGPDGQPGK